MKQAQRSFMGLGILGAALAALLVVSLACGVDKTPTPARSPTSVPAVVSTPAPAPTVAPATPTGVAVAKPVQGGTLRQAIPLSMKLISPWHGADYREQQVVFAVFDSLVVMEPDFKISPGLARSWDVSPDGKAITFHLQKGVKFHDGTDFNAQTVKWQIEKALDPGWLARARSDLTLAIDRVEVVDSSTVTLHLKKPWRPLLGTMSTSQFGFVSPASVAKYGNDYARYAVGTGPFKLEEWQPGLRMILARNAAYWEEGKPYLDRVVMLSVPDRSTQLAMLRTGEADFVDEVIGTELPLLQGNPNLRIVPFQTLNWWSMFMQVNKEPYNSKALRQAIAYAIDRQKLVDIHLAGQGSPAYSNGNFWYKDPTYEPYKYNSQKAKEKLLEAGYAIGVTVPYWCDSSDVELRMCEMIQAMLTTVGITANIIPIPSVDYFKNINEGGCKFCKMAYYPRPDPDYVMRATLHSKGFRGSVVGVNYPEVDKLIDEAAGTYDIAKAGQMYIQAQKIVFDDAAYTGLYYPKSFAAMNKKVQAFTWWTDTLLRFRPMWIEK